jgi:hypothetical protein
MHGIITEIAILKEREEIDQGQFPHQAGARMSPESGTCLEPAWNQKNSEKETVKARQLKQTLVR